MNTVTERFRNDTMTVYSEGTELVFERTFDAPRDVVWQAFMDPDRIPRWWGPMAPRPRSSRWTSASAARGDTSAARPTATT